MSVPLNERLLKRFPYLIRSFIGYYLQGDE